MHICVQRGISKVPSKQLSVRFIEHEKCIRSLGHLMKCDTSINTTEIKSKLTKDCIATNGTQTIFRLFSFKGVRQSMNL